MYGYRVCSDEGGVVYIYIPFDPRDENLDFYEHDSILSIC